MARPFRVLHGRYASGELLLPRLISPANLVKRFDQESRMDLRALAYGIGFAVIWASAFTSTRIIVVDVPPLTALSMRFALSGVFGVMIARALGQRWDFTRDQWRALIIFGFFQNALYLGLNWSAMRHIEASLAAIIASAMPLLVALLEWVWMRKSLSVMAVFGLFSGMVGVALIMGARLSGGADLFGVGLAILGLVSLALATLSVRGATGTKNLLMGVSVQMFVGALVLLVPALVLETASLDFGLRTGAAFAYAIFGPGLAATLLWFALVQHVGALRASVYHFLTPFFGVAIAALFLGETLTWVDIVGVGIITIGILCVQMSRQRELP